MAGLITSAVSLFALTYALIEGNSAGWTSAQIVATFAIAAAAAAILITIEARTAEPMVDLTMFRIRQFSGGLLGITVIGAALRSRQDSALRAGSSPVHAFAEGYHSGVWVTIAVLGLGVVVSYVALRPARNLAVPAGQPDRY